MLTWKPLPTKRRTFIGAGADVRVLPDKGVCIKRFARDMPWRSAAHCMLSSLWALGRLQGSRHVARIIKVLPVRRILVTSYCGVPLTRDNAPVNLWEQGEELIAELAAANVLHRDITKDNVLVHGGILKVVDFAWATKLSDPEPLNDPRMPHLGGLERRGNELFDDWRSLQRCFP